MGEYDHKYGITSDDEVREFHKKRRMFCVKDGELFIAKLGMDYSHAEWFEKEGWMTPGNDWFIHHNLRGIIDQDGNIYFYVGYNFEINSEIEEIFFRNIGNLANRLKLKPTSNIYGGLIIERNKKIPRMKYGTLQDYMEGYSTYRANDP